MKSNKILFFSIIFLIGIGLISSSCKSNSSDSEATAISVYSAQFYFKQMSELKLDVVYESGAEPFVGSTNSGLNFWDITLQNLKALFTGRNVTFLVPKTLAEMRAIPTQNRSVWSTTDAANLATQVRDGDSSGNQGRIFIAFVKGYAANTDGTANTSVIGYSLTGKNIILIFKQVVQSTGALPTGPIPKFVEQSTVVHELAHAVGFVNNGVSLVTAHHDSAHGAHCTNPNCVMYYQNEGASSLVTFIDKYKDSQSVVMFDDACINDAQNF